jgi:hypothetical protein
LDGRLKSGYQKMDVPGAIAACKAALANQPEAVARKACREAAGAAVRQACQEAARQKAASNGQEAKPPAREPSNPPENEQFCWRPGMGRNIGIAEISCDALGR